MATSVNNVALKKCNVNGVKCKKIYVNGVKVWSGEETFTQSIANDYYVNWGNWVDSNGDGVYDGYETYTDDFSNYTTVNIDIPVGETFRINSLSFGDSYLVSTETNLVIDVNGTRIYNQNIQGQPPALGPYPSSTEVYTSTVATGTIQLHLRGKCAANAWGSSPHAVLTISYTTGV